ncbi:MAG: hypothetical protein V5A34_08185 [Halapricum sp.]
MGYVSDTLIGDNRAQTLQDYALGISIVILAVAFTIGYLPTIFDSYDSQTDSVRADQADRAAAYIVTNYSVSADANVLKYDEPGGINRTLSTDAGMTELREQAALNTSTDRRYRPNLNVIIVNSSTLTGGDELVPLTVNGTEYSYGDTYRGQPAERTIRVIQLHNEKTQCDPSCWLVVRVW